ncbi:MAG: hypothetical protein ACJ77L_16460 [Solirubrobacteraceae bacterium]
MRLPDVLRAVPVFDRSQVKPLPDREPAPLEPPTQPITDDSNRRLLGPLHALAGELGYRVDEREDSGAADGWCDHDNKLIVVAGHLAGNAKARVLLHELVHALGIGYADYGRARGGPRRRSHLHRCAGAGLEVSVESVPYVAGWGQEDAVAAVHQFAGTIDTVARRVEHAINPESHQRAAYSADEDLVFCHPERGTVLDHSYLVRRFKRAVGTAGVREVRFHDLRHTFGRAWQPWACRCERSRNGWATVTSRRRSSTPTTRRLGVSQSSSRVRLRQTWSPLGAPTARPARGLSSLDSDETAAVAGIRRMRPRGFEPPRTIRSTRPSTLATTHH